MGTWICHLRIAEDLLTRWPDLDETAFALGNIAPDSGIPNANWTVFDPPKEVTHFLSPGQDEGRIRDLEFYGGYLATIDPAADRARYSFVLGYFTHLLCDNLWSKRIVSASKRDYASLLTERGRVAWSDFKEDWYGLDQCYVRDHADSLFWRVFLTAPYPPAYLPFIPEIALNQQLDYIRNFYSRPDPDWVLDRPYPYLNAATMTQFVAEAAAAISEVCANSDAVQELVGTHTALSVLAPDQVAPYPTPIGDTAWWRP
jgi:hypothetical protein